MRAHLLPLLLASLVTAQNALDPFPQTSCSALTTKIQCYHRKGVMSDQCCDPNAGELQCCGTGCSTAELPCVLMPDDEVKVCFNGTDCGAKAKVFVKDDTTSTVPIAKSTSATSATPSPSSTPAAGTPVAGAETPAPSSSSGAMATAAAGFGVAALVAVGGFVVGL